ncbi:unnamed protein product [Orchesella dallaii]|uniref:Uncharacterized protein n=1 Tax=Orchesella dallaii TaxID=48710 RepID=A0ABP1RBP9_9HEXA
MVNPSNPASDSRHSQHAQNSLFPFQLSPVNSQSTSRNTPIHRNIFPHESEPPRLTRGFSFSRRRDDKARHLVRHSSQGFAVSSTDAFNQNYQPSSHEEDDEYLIEVAKYNSNSDIFAYPVKVQETNAKKPTKQKPTDTLTTPAKKPTTPTKPATTPTKKPTTPTKKPVTPTKTKEVAQTSVQFKRSSHEEKVQLNEEQKRKITRRQTGKLGVKNGKLSQLNFDEDDDEEAEARRGASRETSPRHSFGSDGKDRSKIPRSSFGSEDKDKAKSPRNSFGSEGKGKAKSPRNSGGSGNYKEIESTPLVNTSSLSPPHPQRVSEDKLASDNKNPSKGTETEPPRTLRTPPPPPPTENPEQDEETSSAGGGCNTSAPGCTCGGGQGPNHIQATLLQCYEVPYCNHRKTLADKRQKTNCCQLASNCCNCCCQPSSPTFKVCSCRRCRVYHYCFNVLNRSQIKPEDMYIGLSKYEDLVRQKENNTNDNININLDDNANANDMSCQQNSTGAKNWTNGPPEGYTDSPRDTAQAAQGPFIPPSNRRTSLVDPACCFTTTWQTEYSSQFTDFSDQMRKTRSKYPSYDDNGMGRGRGNGGCCGASPCCGGGGGRQARSSFCYDSRNQTSGCGNYVQMPEEEECHGSRLGGEIQCCVTGNSSCCRPPSYYACQMFENMVSQQNSSNNNNDIMDNDEYNTRRFQTNELVPSCGGGGGTSRPMSHWVAGGGGSGVGGGTCEEDDSLTNFVPKLETLPAAVMKDNFSDIYTAMSGGSSKKRKSSEGSSTKKKKKKTSTTNNSDDHTNTSTEKHKKHKKKEKKPDDGNVPGKNTTTITHPKSKLSITVTTHSGSHASNAAPSQPKTQPVSKTATNDSKTGDVTKPSSEEIGDPVVDKIADDNHHDHDDDEEDHDDEDHDEDQADD